MNLISDEMTTDAAALIERAVQLHADTSALVSDIKDFSLRRGDSLPDGFSPQAQDELNDWSCRALGIDEMFGLLDATISAIVSYHDSGTFEPLSDEVVAERVTLAQVTQAALESSGAALVSAN